jgi:signal transduction histidine kinase
VLVLLQTTGIALLVGYFTYRGGRNAVFQLVQQLVIETEQQVFTELDVYLGNAHRLNQQYASAFQEGFVRLDDLDQLHQYLIKEHLNAPEMTSFLFGSEAGDFRVVHHVEATEIKAGFSKIQPNEQPIELGIATPAQPELLSLYSLNSDNQVGRFLQTIEGIDVRDRPWYKLAKKNQRPGWTKPFQIGSTNLLTINAFRPVFDAQAKFVGVFALNLSFGRINQFLEKLDHRGNGLVYIFDRDGLVIANSEQEPPFTFSGDSTLDEKVVTANPGQFNRLSIYDSTNPILQGILQQQHFLDHKLLATQSIHRESVQLNGKRYYLSLRPYQDEYGLDLLVLTILPSAQFLAPLHADLALTLMTCGFALVGVVGVGLWVTQQVTRPVNDLSRAMEAFNQGQSLPSIQPSQIQELELFRQTFAAAVSEIRTREQTEAHLQQINEELLHATQLKDEFLAMMSHELRTPLNVILGMTENLQEEIFGSITPRQAKALQTIERGGLHLLDLINDVLDLAKIESGQLELDREPTAIAPIVHTSLDFIQTKANQKQISITSQIPEELPWVNVDERRMRQVLLNLLDNAIKFTPEQGKVCVIVRLLVPHAGKGNESFKKVMINASCAANQYFHSL